MMMPKKYEMSRTSGRAPSLSFRELSGPRGPQSGFAPAQNVHREDHEAHEKHAGVDAPEEQFADGLPGVKPVNDEDDAGGDDDAEGRPRATARR